MGVFEISSFFRAVFYRAPAYSQKEADEQTREKTREKILALIKLFPGITTESMAAELELTGKGIEWNLKELRKAGKIRRVGSDKGGHWETLD